MLSSPSRSTSREACSCMFREAASAGVPGLVVLDVELDEVVVVVVVVLLDDEVELSVSVSSSSSSSSPPPPPDEPEPLELAMRMDSRFGWDVASGRVVSSTRCRYG